MAQGMQVTPEVRKGKEAEFQERRGPERARFLGLSGDAGASAGKVSPAPAAWERGDPANTGRGVSPLSPACGRVPPPPQSPDKTS